MAFPKKLTVYAAAMAIALVAWVLNVAQLYWMAGTLLLLPQVSRLFGLLEHRGLEVRRRLPGAGHQGETVTIRYRARNLTGIPKLHLALGDVLPPGLEPADAEPAPIHLVPHGTDETSYDLRLRRRGAHVIPAVRVQSSDILGFYPLESRIPLASTLLVYPRVLELPARARPPEMGGGQTPLEASRRKGEGSSFFGIREYQPGDPLRHVHWRTAARLGRLAVVEWEAEQSTDALLAIETQRGSAQPLEGATTLDLAAGLAGSLTSAILSAGDSLRLLIPGTTEWAPAAHRGIECLPSLLESLARMQDTAEHPLAAELRVVAGQLAPGTLLCWLTPRADDLLVETARYLRAAGLRPMVYALCTMPAGTPDPWDRVVPALESLQVPVIRLHPDDELVVRLLS